MLLFSLAACRQQEGLEADYAAHCREYPIDEFPWG